MKKLATIVWAPTCAILSTLFVLLTISFSQAADVAQPVVQTMPSAGPTAGQTYILGPSDVVEVNALGHSDFDIKAKIGADGTIQLPYLGSVVAANKTTAQLRNDISRALEAGHYFSHFVLTVDVVSYASRYVTVLGGVANPGLITVDRAYRLSEILARAGGVRDGSSDYVVLREEGSPERRFSLESLATGDPAQDPYVVAGDKIFVPTEVFYIKGQVKSPGAFPLMHDMTLAMAVARGGGLTDAGSDSDIKIVRKNVEIDPPDLNFKIQPNDVIDVGESWF